MRRQRIGSAIVALAMILLLLPASGARADATDDAASRELTRYLLAATSGGSGAGEPRTVDLLPAQLPGDLPLTLPTPPGARLVGSAVVHTRNRTAAWDVMYDTPGRAAEINDFFASALPPLGWDIPRTEDRPARGFYPAVISAPKTGLFCAGGASLLVNTGPTPANTLFVRAHIEANGGLCQPASSAGNGQPSASDVLPGLTAPTGVLLKLTSGAFATDRAATDATAATSMSAADLEAHYARQLAGAGWVRVAGDASGPLAWSTWTVPGMGDLRGYLSVLEVSDQDRRDLHVQVEAPSVRVPSAPPAGP